MFPHARRNNLLVRHIGDETVIYDIERHRAHCLTPTAALIWRLCDGRSAVADIARRVEQEMNIKVDAEVVWLALNRLEQAHLLRDLLLRPREIAGISRRHAIELGLAGAASLLVAACGVDSVTAPTPTSTTSNAGPSTTPATRQAQSSHAQPSVPPPSPSPPPVLPCGSLSGDICSTNPSNVNNAACQQQCNPGTPACQQVAPNDFCEGKLGKPFTRLRGPNKLHCRPCSCVCGEFKPGK
jgi:hypothetical protein